jgi:hypothetical protein
MMYQGEHLSGSFPVLIFVGEILQVQDMKEFQGQEVEI